MGICAVSIFLMIVVVLDVILIQVCSTSKSERKIWVTLNSGVPYNPVILTPSWLHPLPLSSLCPVDTCLVCPRSVWLHFTVSPCLTQNSIGKINHFSHLTFTLTWPLTWTTLCYHVVNIRFYASARSMLSVNKCGPFLCMRYHSAASHGTELELSCCCQWSWLKTTVSIYLLCSALCMLLLHVCIRLYVEFPIFPTPSLNLIFKSINQ